jgi:anti-anti-sigma factor
LIWPCGSCGYGAAGCRPVSPPSRFWIGSKGRRRFDCSALDYISSAGLGVLLKTQKRLLASGGKLRLAGVTRHLQDIFGYSGFDRLFEIEPGP